LRGVCADYHSNRQPFAVRAWQHRDRTRQLDQRRHRVGERYRGLLHGNVAFVNAAGTTIGTATSFTIASGVTSSVSLPFASSGLSGSHGALRAVIQVTRSTTTPTPCSLLISLETFETSSGATHLYLSSSETFEGVLGHR